MGMGVSVDLGGRLARRRRLARVWELVRVPGGGAWVWVWACGELARTRGLGLAQARARVHVRMCMHISGELAWELARMWKPARVEGVGARAWACLARTCVRRCCDTGWRAPGSTVVCWWARLGRDWELGRAGGSWGAGAIGVGARLGAGRAGGKWVCGW